MPIGLIRPAIQDDTGFEPKDALPGGAGSTPSLAFYREIATGKRWIGKSSLGTTPDIAERENKVEFVANNLYSYFGAATQHLRFSNQVWLGSMGRGADLLEVYQLTHELPESGLHLMTEMIPGFKELGHYPFFIPADDDYCLDVEGRRIPLRGLGVILAVSALVDDHDTVGGRGQNVGYVLVRGEDGELSHAQAVKIDPGNAFQKSETAVVPDRYLHIAAVVSADVPMIAVDQLPRSVKQEFMLTVAEIVSTPSTLWHDFFSDPLLALLRTPDPNVHANKDAAHCIARLLRNQATLGAMYAAEIAVIQAEQAHHEQHFAEHAKARYREYSHLKDVLGGADLPVAEAFINLSLINAVSETKGEESSALAVITQARAIRMQEQEALAGTAVSATLKRLFAPCTGDTKQVTLWGRAGVGKTSLCQYIIYRYATDDLWREHFDLIVLIPLRMLNAGNFPLGRMYDLYDVISLLYYGRLASEAFKKILHAQLHNPSRILYLLDGLDEARIIPDYLKPVLAKLMAMPNRMVLSRSEQGEALTQDVEYEITGFSDDNVTQYIKRFMMNTPQRAEALLAFIKSNPVLFAIAHTPITLALLSHSFERLEARRLATLALSDVYQTQLDYLGSRFLQKRGTPASAITTLVLAEQLKPLLTSLKAIAYRAMTDNLVLIEEELLRRDLPPTMSPEQQQEHLDKLLQLGLLRAVGISQTGAKQYSFVHLSFQEYLAAQAALQLSERPDELNRWLSAHWLDGRFYLTLNFMAELLSPEGLAEWLKPLGLDLNSQRQGDTPLLAAVRAGQPAFAMALMQAGADVSIADEVGRTPLWTAAYYGQAVCIPLLAQLGADLDLPSHSLVRTGAFGRRLWLPGIAPITAAAQQGHVACLKALITLGADINIVDDNGTTPIGSAAAAGHVVCIRTLAEAGALVDRPTYSRYTPLCIAANRGHEECVRVLIECGAKVEGAGLNALTVAKDSGQTACAAVLEAYVATGELPPVIRPGSVATPFCPPVESVPVPVPTVEHVGWGSCTIM